MEEGDRDAVKGSWVVGWVGGWGEGWCACGGERCDRLPPTTPCFNIYILVFTYCVHQLLPHLTLTDHPSASRRRYRLLPYIYTLFLHANATGAPVMRSLWYEFPSDPDALDVHSSFMLGEPLCRGDWCLCTW